MKRITTVALTVATLAFFAATVAAQQPLEYKVTVTADIVKGSPNDHFMTFSAPVHIPDVTLGAGTYIFRFVGSSAVQVTSADGTEAYAMFFVVPVTRPVALDEYDVQVKFRSYKSPPRVSKIFLPNRLQGFEPLYEEARGDR